MKKYIRVDKGDYRNQNMSGRVFPIVKDYQDHANKPGGFVTVDTSQCAGFDGADKIRITIPTLSSIAIVTEGEWIAHRDSLKLAETPKQGETVKETDEQAIERIADRIAILDEQADPVSTSKVRAMIVSGPPGIGKSYGVERALEKRSMFDDIAQEKRKFEVVKGAMSAIGLYKKLYEHHEKGHGVL